MAVKPLPHALHHQPHGRIRQGHEALDAINFVALHQIGQRSQQALAVLHLQRERHRVEGVVVVVFFLVVVGAALVHHIFNRAAHAQQGVDVDLPGLHAHHLHAGLGVRLDGGLHLCQRGWRQGIGLAEHDQIGHEELIFKQLGQRRLVIEVVIRAALRIHRGRIIGKAPIGYGRRIYHGHHRIHGEGIAQARPLKSLHQRLGQGQARCFNHQMIDLLAPRGELFHHRGKLLLHGAAQAAIGQFKQLAVVGAAFVAAQATAAQQLAINAQFAKLVHDHGNALALRVAQQLAQQGGFARAQKSGHDGGGYFLQVHVNSLLKKSPAHAGVHSVHGCGPTPRAVAPRQ